MEKNTCKYVRWFVGLIVIIAVCVSAYVIISKYNDSLKYDDEDSFINFASHEMERDNMLPDAFDDKIVYSYDESVSTAVRKNSNQADKLVKSVMSNADSDTDAILVETSVTESGTGAITVAAYARMYKAGADKKMKLQASYIETKLLSAETKRSIKSIQALNVTYRDKAYQYANKYFTNMYGQNRMVESAEDTLDPDNNDNYSKYIMTKKGIVFFFDQGSVVDDKYGVTSVEVPSEFMDYAIRPRVIKRYIDPNKPMVAITFDDGPGDASEKRILKCLEKHGAVATFFYVGYRVDDFAYNGKKALQIGCEIGNHSWDHPTLTTCNKKQILSQINRTNKAIKKSIGVEPTLLRPPYGDYSDRVQKITKMPSIFWTIDTLDWKTRNPNKIFKSVKNTKNLDGKIILMHSIYNETAAATEKIVPWLEENGYQTVTISELIEYKTGEAPKAKSYRTFK